MDREKVIKVLPVTPEWTDFLESSPFPDHRPSGNTVFAALVKSIIYQQLSVKAAGTIYNRFLELFDNREFNPGSLIAQHENHT